MLESKTDKAFSHFTHSKGQNLFPSVKNFLWWVIQMRGKVFWVTFWGLEIIWKKCSGPHSLFWKRIQKIAGLHLRKMGFPGGSDGKASACNVRDQGSIPGSGRSPGEGNGNPLQHSCLENPSPWGCEESDTTERLHFTSLPSNLWVIILPCWYCFLMHKIFFSWSAICLFFSFVACALQSFFFLTHIIFYAKIIHLRLNRISLEGYTRSK